MEEFDIRKHSLVPEHMKLTEEEKQDFLKKFNINIEKIPMINKNDPSIQQLEPKVGDIIKIIRNAPTNKGVSFYRAVVHG